jgi:peptide/nickel transport system ATP-binding protein
VPSGIEARGLIQIHPGPQGGVAALRGLDVSVEPGEIAAVVGPSGSGKSTFLRLLAGLARPTAGSLNVLGLALERASERELEGYRARQVGSVEQHYWRSLSPYLSVADSIGQPLRLRGPARRARERRVGELLERIRLADRASALPRELSGGEQQRVAFASALAIRPALLLADEPTGELDDVTAASLLEAIADLVRAEGSTCVIVTHDELVEGIATRSIYLQDGRAIAERVGGELFTAVDPSGWRAPAPVPPEPPARAEAPSSSAGSAVALESVARSYRQGRAAISALHDVSATFAAGGFHVVTGPSGSGKTSLLRLITGLDLPDAGRVVTLGQDVATLDRDAAAALRARRIGIVDQAPRLVPFLTALENVALSVRIRGLAGSDPDALAAAALERLGVLGFRDRLPDALSAGERTRVAIARAVAAEPGLLVLDEPTAALDRQNARAVARLLAGLAGPEVTVIAATHDRDLINAASGRLDLRRSGTPQRATPALDPADALS